MESNVLDRIFIEKSNILLNELSDLKEESLEIIDIDDRINQFIDDNSFDENIYKFREEENKNSVFDKYLFIEELPTKSNNITISKITKIKSKFLKKLYFLLNNEQNYDHIICWKYGNNKKIVIIIKDKKKVLNLLCPKSNISNFSTCVRQLNNYSFNQKSFKKDSNIYVTHPTLENINDIITLQKKKRKRKINNLLN